ncbi:ubiquitin-conjugating enzyme E2 J2 isoform X1 [Phocoena sinus]|nr:ubiquitin-conjugating enzyme E2 J2 isoform X1 [Phocoena sinus]
MLHRVTDRKSLRCAALRVYGHRHDDRVAPVLSEEESELPAEHAQGPCEPQPPGRSLEAVLAGAHKADGAVDGAVGAEGGDQLPQRGAQLHQPLPTPLLGRGRWWRWRQLGARSGPRPPTSCLGHGSSLNPRSEPQWGPSPPSGLTPPRCPHPGPRHRLPFSVPGNSRDRRVPQPPVAQLGLLMPKRGSIRSWSILGTDAAALPCDDRQGTRRPPRMSSNSAKRAPTTATQRLKQDYLRIKKDPVPYICAEPLPSNILEWHYVVRGPEMTPYEGGYYHGKLIFPREFPFKPPSIYMITPNGRFKCNTRLCLSITDFHPDTWNPAWSVSTILTGLLSFMVEKGPTLGSIETSDFTKRQLAAQSLVFNLKDKVFCELFPEVVEEIKQKQRAQDELSSRPQALPLPDVVPDGETHHGQNGLPLLNGHAPGAGPHLAGLQQANRHHGLLGGALANLFVIVGFAAFAYTVKYVLRSIAQE